MAGANCSAAARASSDRAACTMRRAWPRGAASSRSAARGAWAMGGGLAGDDDCAGGVGGAGGEPGEATGGGGTDAGATGAGGRGAGGKGAGGTASADGAVLGAAAGSSRSGRGCAGGAALPATSRDGGSAGGPSHCKIPATPMIPSQSPSRGRHPRDTLATADLKPSAPRAATGVEDIFAANHFIPAWIVALAHRSGPSRPRGQRGRGMRHGMAYRGARHIMPHRFATSDVVQIQEPALCHA